MKKEEFSLVLGDVRDDFIAQAHQPVRSRKPAAPAWRRWCAAACLCLVTASALLATHNLPMKERADGNQYTSGSTIIQNFQVAGEACYKAPDPGEYFCFIEVNAARERYAGQNVKYLLKMDVFQNGKQVAVGDLGGEFKRLAALGYDLRIVNREEQEGDEIIVWPEAVGLFTEEQLQSFPADPAYGYTFSFHVDTDGNLIRSDDPAVITGADIPE